MIAVKRCLKRVPGASLLYRKAVQFTEDVMLRTRSPNEVFRKIYEKNSWGGVESVSGPGSDRVQTVILEAELLATLRELAVESMLDIPCGDFHWMKNVDLGKISYVGADIVNTLVKDNREKYGSPSKSFRHLNLLEDALPRADLILCRDCLVHFSDRDVQTALKNIVESGSKYLLTTTFPGRKNGVDIATGQWRPLDLQASPFCLPEPMSIINENCTEGGGRFRDKSVALWQISEIAHIVLRRA